MSRIPPSSLSRKSSLPGVAHKKKSSLPGSPQPLIPPASPSSLSFSLSLDDGDGTGGVEPQAGESSSPTTSLPGPLPLAAPLLPPPLTPHRNRSTGEEGWRGEERRPRPASRSRAARGAATGERKRSGGGAWVQSAWARASERRGPGAGAHGPERGRRVIIEAGVEEVEEGLGREGLAVGIGRAASGACGRAAQTRAAVAS